MTMSKGGKRDERAAYVAVDAGDRVDDDRESVFVVARRDTGLNFDVITLVHTVSGDEEKGSGPRRRRRGDESDAQAGCRSSRGEG